MTPLRRVTLAAILAAASTAIAAGPTLAATGENQQPLLSTGAPLKDPASRHYTVPKQAQKGVAAKLKAVASLNAAARKAHVPAIGVPANLAKHKLQTGTPRITSYVLPNVANYKEGGGNPCKAGTPGCSSLGHPKYTCAANSTRNMIKMLTGTDYGEAQFVTWEGIKPDIGLPSINNIANTLNGHFSKYGSWTTHQVTSLADYMAGIETDTLQYGQAVIQDLDTKYFGYWKNYSLKHYNIVYGWNSTTSTVAISEGWNPVFTYGQDLGYGNPYGLHPTVVGLNAYHAVADSPTKRYVL